MSDEEDEELEFEDEEGEDEDEDEDFEFDEEEEEDLSEPEIEEEEELEEEEEEELEEPPPPEEEIQAIPPEEIPLTLSIEVGRVEMSADELLKLGPGNTIDLKTPASKSVHLMVGGKCVGKGELIQMGDVLGVRILSL